MTDIRKIIVVGSILFAGYFLGLASIASHSQAQPNWWLPIAFVAGFAVGRAWHTDEK